MDYIKDLIQVNTNFLSYGTGQIMFKTKLALGLAKVEPALLADQDIQRDRDTTLVVDANLKKHTLDAPGIMDIIGEKYKNRGKVFCAAKATIYGMAQTIVAATRQHSIYGLNKKYVTTEGLPNETVIIKRLRELGISSDVKEARYGRFYNAVFANDFYDNATALIVKLYLRYQLLKMIGKTQVFDHTIKFTASQVMSIVRAGDEMAQLEKLALVVRNHEDGAQIISTDQSTQALLADIIVWSATLPAQNILVGGVHLPNPEYVDARLVKTVKVWKMYDYNDGHSRSGNHFGDTFGFIKNRFIVPVGQHTTDLNDVYVLQNTKDNWFSDDATVDNFKNYFGFLNCSGLTSKDLAILDNIIQDDVRHTPFLCDQVIDLGIEGKIGITTPTQIVPMTTTYSAEEVRAIIIKLVNNHRWHEDMLAALRACKYWLAQPATETVEAHWWTQIPRTLYLPKLGLKRAAIHILLQEEGVCTTAEAIQAVRSLDTESDSLIIESVFANTCWYWGEYFTIFNKKNLMDLLVGLSRVTNLTVDEHYRADAMFSAVIGRAVPTGAHSCVATVWTEPLRSCYNKRVPFGTLNFQNITDYGYDIRDNYILMNTIVAPSCITLIAGLAGSLIAGTPYGSIYNISPGVKKRNVRRVMQALNYNDLWALGVLSRFQGYNVNYQHPTRNGRHTIYAANDVSVAMPPVTPKDLEEPKSYTLESIVARDYTFGTSTEFCLRTKTTVYWSRDIPSAQLEPNWNAPSGGHVLALQSGITEIRVATDAGQQYTVALAAVYDFETADFRVEHLHAGVPLPTTQGVLPLIESQEDKPPDPPEVRPVEAEAGPQV